MRKKLHIVLFNLMIMFAALFIRNTGMVFAREVSGEWKLSSSQTISAEIINIDDIINTANDDSAIHITNNANIILDGVTLQFGNNVNADQLIKVDFGCTLELNNVRMIAGTTQSVGIINNGTLKINGLYLEKISSSIINNSSSTDSVQIYNANSPLAITLNQGYVSVYESTRISETITLDMGENEFVDTMIGKILVKGRNTLASFYEDKFVLNDTPVMSSFDTPEQYLEYLQTNQPYMLDHVGDIGDALNAADDGYSSTTTSDAGVTISVNNLESGDLIFTKFINYLRLSGADEGNDIYVSAKYATAEKFIEITGTTYLARSTFATLESIANEDRLLNNYHTLKATKNNLLLQKSPDPTMDKADINIDVYAGDKKINALSQTVQIISGGAKAVFIDIDGYEFDDISTSKSSISIISNIQNARFIRPIIAVESGVTSGTVRVDLISNAPAVTNVDIALEQSTFTYSKTDYISQVKPYYILNENKVYLTEEEYTIYNSQSIETDELINTDTYTIVCVSTNDAIEFNENNLNIVVNPKIITLNFNNSFTYDGTAKSVTASVIGGEFGDQINVSFANNSRTLPGSQNVDVSIDNANYILDGSYTSTTLTINKITIDMSAVRYEDLTFTYDGEEHEHLAINIPAGVSVTYENNKQTNVKQGTENYYTAIARFSVDEDYYNPLTVTELTCKITINRAIINANDVEFNNVSHYYDGNPVTLRITGELPDGIASVNYTNNIQTEYSDVPYVARATFVIDEDYADNYIIVPAYKEATITILRANGVNVLVDTSVFTYAKTDYIAQVKPYYMLNENKVYLTEEEYTIYNSQSIETDELINADTYTIVCVSANDAIEFNENNLNIIVNPKIIALNFNNTFTYDGTAKSVTASVIGGEPGDQINVSFTNNSRVLPGSQNVGISIDNSNYILDGSYTSTTLTINKITIDMSAVRYEDLTFTYDGEEHEHLAINIPAGVSVAYENNKQTNVKQGAENYYTAIARFSVDEDYYNPLTVTELTCKITINRAIIDTNDVIYDNIVHTYDKNEVELIIATQLPAGIKRVDYTNNKHTNHSDEPYVARATFVIDEAYADNYIIEPAYKEATITINKAYVDFSNFKFENVTIQYDGNSHSIIATGFDPELINIAYASLAYTDVGTYPQNIILTLIDTHNYYSLTDAETNRTAILTIDKATINMNGIGLDDVTTTYDGQEHSIQVSGNTSHLTICYEYYLADTLLYELPINAGTYRVVASFTVTDWSEENYEKIDSMTATLTINKAIIDTSMVTYDDVYHQYDGSSIEHKVSGDLPFAIYKVNYTNNIQKSYRSDPYIATAVFVLKDEYKDNYVASPSSLTSKIYITQAVIDFGNLKFEDKTVMYDGKSHSIVATGLDTNKVRIEYLSESHTDIGTYTQEIRITLRDVINYEPIPEDKAYVTATLKIIPAKIDIAGITFESQTFSYVPNTPRELKISGSVDNVVATYKYYNSEGYLLSDLPVDSGVYDVYVYFSVDGWSEELYEEIPCMQATLTINKVGINFTYVAFNSQSFVYDGQPHSLTLKNMPTTVTYEILNNNHTNVGNYNVTVNVNYDIKNYYLINYTPLNAVLSITQATIDMSGIKFESKTYEYDGVTKTIEISGTVPEFVSIKEYGANSRKDVGTSNAYVSFNVNNNNYKAVDNMYCQLTINPKPITVGLKTNTFTYTGDPITVEVYATGVINGDNISIQTLNAINTNAGVYYANVASLGNSNYVVQGSTTLRYEIKKADYDMSGISFTNTQVVYDGQTHSPELAGSIPNELMYNIIGGYKVNAGEYDVYCEFILSNFNYNLPNPLQTKLKINPRPILVTFADCSGIVADGSFKGVNVSFVGLVDNNFDGYTLNYSATPINAGTYTCTVDLKPNSNYVIINKNSITYQILTSTMSYTDPVYDVIVEGDGFSVDNSVTIIESNSADIEPTISAMHVKKYKAFEISVDDATMNEEIDVTIAIKAFAVENVKYLKLYKLESGKLKEIEYIRDNGKLKFTANTNDQIILIEELTEVDKNQVWIYLIISLAMVAFMIMLSISIVYIMSKKKTK